MSIEEYEQRIWRSWVTVEPNTIDLRVEELYQLFKARLTKELFVESTAPLNTLLAAREPKT